MKVKKGIRSKSNNNNNVRKHFHSLVSTFVYLKIYLEKIYWIPLYSYHFDGGIKMNRGAQCDWRVQINVVIQYDKYNKNQYNCGSWCLFPFITLEWYDQQELRSPANKILWHNNLSLSERLSSDNLNPFKVTLQEVGWEGKARITSIYMLYL